MKKHFPVLFGVLTFTAVSAFAQQAMICEKALDRLDLAGHYGENSTPLGQLQKTFAKEMKLANKILNVEAPFEAKAGVGQYIPRPDYRNHPIGDVPGWMIFKPVNELHQTTKWLIENYDNAERYLKPLSNLQRTMAKISTNPADKLQQMELKQQRRANYFIKQLRQTIESTESQIKLVQEMLNGFIARQPVVSAFMRHARFTAYDLEGLEFKLLAYKEKAPASEKEQINAMLGEVKATAKTAAAYGEMKAYVAVDYYKLVPQGGTADAWMTSEIWSLTDRIAKAKEILAKIKTLPDPINDVPENPESNPNQSGGETGE